MARRWSWCRSGDVPVRHPVHLELAAGELPIDIVARGLMPASDRVIAPAA
jgi:hypothetical protein